MKKCLNISLLLLVFLISGSLSCESWSDKSGFLPVDSRRAPEETTTRRVPEQAPVVSTVETIPTENVPQSMPSYPPSDILKPALVSVSESGSSVVSRTYPWAECGIVQLDKIMPKEAKLNQQFTYTIKITNLTDTLLSDIIVNEEYPGNFKLINTNPQAQESQNRLTWKIESLEPKAVRQITVSGMADNASPLKYSTTVQTPVLPAVANIEVIQPSIKLVKSVPTEVMLCDLIPVKYTIKNDGTGTVTHIRIIDTLPAGLKTQDSKDEVLIDAGSLVENQSREYTVELRATRVGAYSSKAVANSTDMGLRAESAEITTVVSQPVLALSKTGPDHLYIGRPVTYEIIVTNKSQVTAKDIVVEDTMPEGVSSVKATQGAQLSESNTKLTWKLEKLAPNTSETFRVSYTPTQPGVITNGATATAYCAQAVSASIRTVVTGIPAVMLEVADMDDPVRTGNRVTYVITVTNQGSAPLTNILIACVLESNVKYISSAGSTSGSMEGDRLRFLPLGSLAPQEKAVWRIVVHAVTPGDVRFKVIMNSDELSRPVEKTESTYLYE
ncbi:MAG: DUF11 domain-containing protein [Sedimentisphaerales bacterium]|nr:DUF11 domain-containing protein [Sedimentisphaerales bacterium]